jgi:hypothetical protein
MIKARIEHVSRLREPRVAAREDLPSDRVLQSVAHRGRALSSFCQLDVIMTVRIV